MSLPELVIECARRIGVCFDQLVIPTGVSKITFDALWLDSLPHDTFDIPMQYVVTEKGLYSIPTQID